MNLDANLGYMINHLEGIHLKQNSFIFCYEDSPSPIKTHFLAIKSSAYGLGSGGGHLYSQHLGARGRRVSKLGDQTALQSEF